MASGFRVLLASLLAVGALLAPALRAQLAERGGKTTGAGASAEAARQGASVALSADGTTAIEGGPHDAGGRGAVWVFLRGSGGWVQQGEKLVAADELGEHASLGISLALSADGATALVGGSGDGSGTGAAWVFTRSDGEWKEQAKLIGGGAIGLPAQGSAVALSADGNTALVGGPGDNHGVGAAWVFTRAAGAWSQQGLKLTGSGADGPAGFGRSVSLSADGSIALVGGPEDSRDRGAAWAFERAGEAWTQHGGKLAGTGSEGTAVFQGSAVCLSGDGTQAVIGGYGDARNAGAAWWFERSGESWVQQGEKLSVAGAEGAQSGYSAALSPDGARLLLGAPGADEGLGAAWEFDRANGEWNLTGKLRGAGAVGPVRQGGAVGLSGQGGSQAIVGGAGDSRGGGFWTFAQPLLAISAPATATAGAPVTLSVTAQDDRGEPLIGYSGTVRLTSSDGQAVLPPDAGLTAGTGTFTAIFTRSGGQTLTATDASHPVIAAATVSVQVSAGPAARLVLNGPASALPGEPVAFSVSAADRFNNPASLPRSIHFTSSDPRAALPAEEAASARPLAGSVGASRSFLVRLGTDGRQTLTATAASASGSIGIDVGPDANPKDYVSTVLATNPIAYFRLKAASDTSQVNSYTSTFEGGASASSLDAPVCNEHGHSVSLNGSSAYVATSLSGQVNTAGTMAAWVCLAQLPSAAGRFFYVEGESHEGNDFDIQFTTDNYIRFYVSNASINVGYLPDTSTLVDTWHMVVATFDAGTNTENLYWDGQLAAAASNAPLTDKTTAFSIGQSTVFKGRAFYGNIGEVAVWNYALSATQVGTIFNAATCYPTESATDSESIKETDTVAPLLSLLHTDSEAITETDSVTPRINPLEALTVKVNPANGGTVTGAGSYARGTRVRIKATPNSSFAFDDFSGGVPTTKDNPIEVTLLEPTAIDANFTVLEPALTVAPAGARTGGTVTGTLNVPIAISNAGKGEAQKARIAAVKAEVLDGSGSVVARSGIPSAPVTLTPGASVTLHPVFDWPATATRAKLLFTLTATDAAGKSVSATQTLTLSRE